MLAIRRMLRYTPYMRAVEQIVDFGQLGDIMSVEHLESVEQNGTAPRREYSVDATTLWCVRTRVRTSTLMLNET